jgi:hypothetical protein
VSKRAIQYEGGVCDIIEVRLMRNHSDQASALAGLAVAPGRVRLIDAER